MKSSTDTNEKKAVEVATIVSPEVRIAVTRVILAEGDPEVSKVLRDKRGEVVALVQELLASAGINANFSMSEPEGGKKEEEEEEVDIGLSEVSSEISSEVLDSCLQGLEKDFKRGIVAIDENSDVDAFKSQLEKDRSAGTTWETVKERLLANDSKLLKKTAIMQGKGELVGVFENGEFCFVDRSDKDGNREPVIIAFDAQNNRITITTDTPYRADVMQDVARSGRFANYWEIRAAVGDDGFTIPPDSLRHEKKGIVAAVEAVSGEPFVRSQNGRGWRSAIIECGDVSSSADVRVVCFRSSDGYAAVCYDVPHYRVDNRGAVRVLRG